jgi:hypothetical protein
VTDEQLQALFAGIERHLDKRSDATDQRVAAADAVRGLDALRRKLRGICLSYTVIIEKAANNYSA